MIFSGDLLYQQVILNANDTNGTNARKNQADGNQIYKKFNLFYICENLRFLC